MKGPLEFLARLWPGRRVVPKALSHLSLPSGIAILSLDYANSDTRQTHDTKFQREVQTWGSEMTGDSHDSTRCNAVQLPNTNTRLISIVGLQLTQRPHTLPAILDPHFCIPNTPSQRGHIKTTVAERKEENKAWKLTARGSGGHKLTSSTNASTRFAIEGENKVEGVMGVEKEGVEEEEVVWGQGPYSPMVTVAKSMQPKLLVGRKSESIPVTERFDPSSEAFPCVLTRYGADSTVPVISFAVAPAVVSREDYGAEVNLHRKGVYHSWN